MTAYEKDLDEKKPVVVHGVRGAKSKPFKKKFRSMAHFEKWHDENGGDHEVHHVQNESALALFSNKVSVFKESVYGALYGKIGAEIASRAKVVSESRDGYTHEVVAHHNDGKGFQARHLDTHEHHDFRHNPKSTHDGELPPVGSHIKANNYRKRGMNEEAPAPNRPKGEQDIIDLHHVEIQDDPVAGENQFKADYISKDRSRSADQEDGEDDWPENSDAKLRKVVMHGTGDRVYDEDEIEEGVSGRPKKSTVKKKRDVSGTLDRENKRRRDMIDRDEYEVGHGYSRDRKVKAPGRSYNPTRTAVNQNHNYQQSFARRGEERKRYQGKYGTSAGGRHKFESLNLNDADLDEGVVHSAVRAVRRYLDKRGGWDSRQANRIRKRADRKASVNMASVDMAAKEHDSKALDLAIKNGMRAISTFGDKKGRMGRGYMGAHKPQQRESAINEVSAGKLKRYMTKADREMDPDYDGSYHDRKQENRQSGFAMAAAKLHKAGHKGYEYDMDGEARVAAGNGKTKRTTANVRSRKAR